MNKHRVSCLFGLIMGLVMASGYAVDNGRPEVSNPQQNVIVKKTSPHFTIVLQSNPTTGYRWSLKQYDSNFITPVGNKFIPPTNQRLIGAGGYEQWMFDVKPEAFNAAHQLTVSFIYARSWERGSGQGVSFNVVTTNDN